MKENFYIDAAVTLGLITAGDDTAINEDNTVITKGDNDFNVDSAIINKAIYLDELSQIKTMRQGLLAESDWTVMSDNPIANKDAWITYRQELRDCPADLVEGSEDEFTYPASPDHIDSFE